MEMYHRPPQKRNIWNCNRQDIKQNQEKPGKSGENLEKLKNQRKPGKRREISWKVIALGKIRENF